MSFLFETFAVPLWFLVFSFGCAAPLWIKWYLAFYKKFIVTGILQRKLRKTSKTAEEKIDILKKATDNWNASAKQDIKATGLKKSRDEHEMSSAEQSHVKTVLKALAFNGDTGMLMQSISDNLGINIHEVKSSLSYLEKNELVEEVVGGNGTKYYLTVRGKKYCIKRGYV